MIYESFNNLMHIFMIMFEKYGGDPMKRSINNRLVTQMGCAMILHNLVSTSIFTWRVIFGPVYLPAAVFESFIVNIWLTWSFLLLTEMSVIKALMIFKWSYIVAIEETFTGTFLIVFNLGFAIISQTARFVNFCYQK